MKIQSVLSGSSGVAIALWNSDTLFLLDAGFQRIKQSSGGIGMEAELIRLEKVSGHKLKAVLLSHCHSDHFGPTAASVAKSQKLHIISPEPVRFRAKDINNTIITSPDAFDIGSFRVKPFKVRHAPGFTTLAYRISDGDSHAMFFVEGRPNFEQAMCDVDFIYVEANHDYYLVERLPNPGSAFHLSNEEAGRLVGTVMKNATDLYNPIVVIGNMSEARNTPALAYNIVTTEIYRLTGEQEKVKIAPRFRPSPVWEV